MKKVISLLTISFLLIICSSCGDVIDNEKPRIVTTIFPIYDMVKAISDERINISLMVAPGQDIHSYDPSASDIIEAKKANSIIYIGDQMESWVKDIKSNEQLVVKLTDDERIHLESLEHHVEHSSEEHNHNVDMHIWTNPRYAIYMIEQIRDALIKIDEENKVIYQTNAEEYILKLKEIIEEVKNIVALAQNKTLYFGAPFAFYYFTEEFGLDHATIYDTCSIEVEPTIDKMVAMNEMLKKNQVKILYTKELLNDTIARKIVEDTNAKIHILHSAHNVSVEDFKKGITYLEIWENNLEALRKGLL